MHAKEKTDVPENSRMLCTSPTGCSSGPTCPATNPPTATAAMAPSASSTTTLATKFGSAKCDKRLIHDIGTTKRSCRNMKTSQ
eukprot:4547573-Amphidinium_carterae.1